jgi:uncharacterized protein
MRYEEMPEDEITSNASSEPAIRDVIAVRMSRRAVLKGIVGAGFFGLVGGCASLSGRSNAPSSPLGFAEIPRVLDETTHVAPGYTTQILMRWGDPIHRGGPVFRPGRQTPAEQEVQFGMDNDFIAYMPLPRRSHRSDRGLLCVNHERNTPQLAWPGMTAKDYASRMTREQCEVEMASQGHTVIEVARLDDVWRLVEASPYSRRITARSTVTRLAGPVAGHPRLRTSADPAGTHVIGTLNNCAGGVTPWGTVLTAEENLHNYFTGNASRGPEAAAWKRYGVNGRGRYVWGRHIERFNLDREPHEPNRFGWVVEIDPYDPRATPVKRTALGRFKHECATTAVSHDGRIAVYSGDDERMEYVYKFVTRRAYDPRNRAPNGDLLDEGILYVARFRSDGTMTWLPLLFGEGPLTPANGFSGQGEVVLEARRAADLLGATPMDRPEDVEANPFTGRVYVVMTFNERRRADEVDAANPRGPNRFGHIIEIVPPEADGRPDHTATECTWDFFIAGGDPADATHGARYGGAVTSSGWIAAPDNVAFDPRGRIWIATDGQPNAAGFADSLYAAETAGPQRAVTRCFFAAPRGAEVCGPAFTPDARTLFLAIQHPAAEDGSTFDRPSTRWPDFEPGMPPRPSVIAITKVDGGEIGS